MSSFEILMAVYVSATLTYYLWAIYRDCVNLNAVRERVKDNVSIRTLQENLLLMREERDVYQASTETTKRK
jgi:hypothetical protein